MRCLLLLLISCGGVPEHAAMAQELDTDEPIVIPLLPPEDIEEEALEELGYVLEEDNEEESPEASEDVPVDPTSEVEPESVEVEPIEVDLEPIEVELEPIETEPEPVEIEETEPEVMPTPLEEPSFLRTLPPIQKKARPIQQVQEVLDRGEALDWYLADKLNQKTGKTPEGWEIPDMEVYKIDPRSHAPNALELYPELQELQQLQIQSPLP